MRLTYGLFNVMQRDESSKNLNTRYGMIPGTKEIKPIIISDIYMYIAYETVDITFHGLMTLDGVDDGGSTTDGFVENDSL